MQSRLASAFRSIRQLQYRSFASENSKAIVYSSFAPEAFGAQYVVACPKTKTAAIIDSVLDYDPLKESLTTKEADKLLKIVHENNLDVKWILETHIHADHVTAATYLKQELTKGNESPQIGISKFVTQVQKEWAKKYQLDIACDGSQFDKLIEVDEKLPVGELNLIALSTPGHTPTCTSFLIPNDAIFVGDTFFMPDTGTARCDFPGGSAALLWDSLQTILSVGDDVRMFLAHDYRANNTRPDYLWETTVGEQKKNLHLFEKERESYIEVRETRDKSLSLPRFIHPSLQLNLVAGNPNVGPSGEFFVKIPHRIEWLKK